jgi:hypothetical protein
MTCISAGYEAIFILEQGHLYSPFTTANEFYEGGNSVSASSQESQTVDEMLSHKI